MKILAFMPVHNEADVLPYVLAHMNGNGIRVHVLDGWSTDGSWELLQTLIMCGMPVTAERFPADRDDGVWNCRRTLARIEQLAVESDADWCYLSDADEWRRTNWLGEALERGIVRVASEGYNAIDHEVFSFACTDAGWTGSPENYFRHYDPADLIARLPQIKAWRNWGQSIDLVSSGGHEARFPGRNVFPQKFLMKHYPYRTPEQARRKIETRLARRCHEEHRDGWGVHYDEKFPPGFLWDPAKLQEWREPVRIGCPA